MRSFLALFLCGLFLSSHAQSDSTFWKPLNRRSVRKLPPIKPLPKSYSVWSLNWDSLWVKIPSVDQPERTVDLWLPLPGDSLVRFRVRLAPILSPTLARKYPEIRSLEGKALKQSSCLVRLEFSAKGLRGEIRSPQGTFRISPYSKKSKRIYLVYLRDDLQTPSSPYAPKEPRN